MATPYVSNQFPIKAPMPPQATKLYTLCYRGQVIVRAQPYAVCNGKKSELIGTGQYSKHSFTINRHL